MKRGACVAKDFLSLLLYSFANFDKVDDVLHVLFKILESKAPLDYAMCIQVGLFNKENSYQIKTLATLECFGKIIMAADSAYRYKFNKNCRYETSSVGIFQCKTGTIEVHEFVNKQNQIKQITKEKESNI